MLYVISRPQVMKHIALLIDFGLRFHCCHLWPTPVIPRSTSCPFSGQNTKTHLLDNKMTQCIHDQWLISQANFASNFTVTLFLSWTGLTLLLWMLTQVFFLFEAVRSKLSCTRKELKLKSRQGLELMISSLCCPMLAYCYHATPNIWCPHLA